MMTELTLTIPDKLLERLQDEANFRQIPIDDLVQTALVHYFDEDEPTKEEILAGVREAIQDVLAGRVRPAREFLEEWLE